MKRLYLLRHAKSSWKQANLADHERPLNRRGIRDAPRMGIALRGFMPAMAVVTSTAMRARLTLAGLCEGWPELDGLPHRSDPALYTFSVDDLYHWLRASEDAVPARFLIGHNPALTDLLALLAPGDAIDNLPTAGFAAVQLEVDRWFDIGPGCGRVERLLFPKQL
jgi:phosphohistidine phosphatase